MFRDTKTILVLLIGFITLFCFGFVAKANAATYYTSGYLYSTNLLSAESVNSVDKFGYNSTIPADTTLKVQFSQDNTTWYSANHTVDVWSDLSTGDHLAEGDALALSGWSPEYNFYYRILFETTDTSITPALEEIKVWYNLGSYAAVTTDAVNTNNITGITATADGTISSIGSSTVTERGFQYGVSVSFYNEVSETGSFGTGSYSLGLSNLYANAFYYVRAFVANTEGRAYGEWQTFTTQHYYYTAATLYSTNLLSGLTITTIDSFWTSATVPAGTTLLMQFSPDNTNWYSAAGVLNETTAVPNGSATTSLSASIPWSGANFYYKMQFTSDTTATSILEETRVNYDMPAGDAPALQIKGGLKVKAGMKIK